MSWLLALHAAATLAMTGVAWFVQLVHYPLFDRADRRGFEAFEAEHQRRTGWVVAPLMVTEAATAAALLAWPPPGIPVAALVAGLAAVAALWASTAFVQVPLHRRLGSGYDEVVHRRLVGTSWIRTVLWTARGAWAAWLAVAFG